MKRPRHAHILRERAARRKFSATLLDADAFASGLEKVFSRRFLLPDLAQRAIAGAESMDLQTHVPEHPQERVAPRRVVLVVGRVVRVPEATAGECALRPVLAVPYNRK